MPLRHILNQKLRKKWSGKQATKNRGATLLELLVGITLGLLTVVVMLGAIVVSRGVSLSLIHI